MATYVTKKCPHCGYAYQIHQSGEQRKYGCPHITCIRCSNSYWDKDIKEPALHGYQNAYEVRQSISRILTILLYGSISLILLIKGLSVVFDGAMDGLILIAIGGLGIWIIGSYIKRKIDENNRLDEIATSQRKEYDASIERLKDSNYLAALANYDSKAKKLLFERINCMEEHYANRP